MTESLGESIWDISSWRKDLSWKDEALRAYFDSLDFEDCLSKIMSLLNEYFESVYHNYQDQEEGSDIDFNCLDQLVFITEEYTYGHYYYHVSPIQELQMMETFCSYFQDNPLDPVRFFVFDCLFGIPMDNLDIQKGFIEHKMGLICKLASIAVGTRCGNVLNCVAVWMHTYGAHHKRAYTVACALVNDYCCVCPSATRALRDLIDVSPVFACQFAVSLADHYHDVMVSGLDEDKLPPPILVHIIATWVVEQPQFCAVRIPPLFLQLPSIHKCTRVAVDDKTSPFVLFPILKLVRWCIVEPLSKTKTISMDTDTDADDNLKVNKNGADNQHIFTAKQLVILSHAYSRLLYGFLNYISSQKKVEPPPSDNPDDLEPGELEEENELAELLSAADIMSYVVTFQKMTENRDDLTDDSTEESIDRFVQIIQLANYVGCITASPKKLLSLLQLLPSTPLLVKVMSAIKLKATKIVPVKAKKI